MPAFRATVGMPASAAFAARADRVRAGKGDGDPSTSLSIAFCTSVACSPASGSLEYFRLTLRSSAACSAPARTRSQNVAPGASWVTMAMV